MHFQSCPKPIKQIFREKHVKLVDTLDVSQFEHLLPKNLKDLQAEISDRRGKIRAVLDNLSRSPDAYSEGFTKILAGLYPDIFEEITGRKPTDIESGNENTNLQFLDYTDDYLICEKIV